MSEMERPTEEWRTIPEFPDYAVSNMGNVKRISSGNATHAGRLKSPSLNSRGYLIVRLRRDGKSLTKPVHILVGRCFIGLRPVELQTNHIDGDKLNNHVHNLEYVSASENIIHALRLGLSSPRKGERNPLAKLTKQKVLEIRASASLGYAELGRKYSVRPSTIWAVLTRRTWREVEG
jgi:hypothetical protein